MGPSQDTNQSSEMLIAVFGLRNLKSDKIPSIHDKDLAVPVTYVVSRPHNRLEGDSARIAGASQARFDNPEQLLRPHQIALNTFTQVRSFVVSSLPSFTFDGVVFKKGIQ